MERKSSNVRINVDYLQEIVSKSGLTHSEFAKTIGRTKSFVWNAKDRGIMQRPAAELLCKVHGADINKLLISEESESKESTPPYADAESIETLVNAILNLEKKIDVIIAELF